MSRRIDLNCDLGESFGAWRMGDDEAVLEHVSSANIACGFHAGDPATMRRTVQACAARGVAIGAHPSLPDLQGFGRREMRVSPDETYALALYQVGALDAFARAQGARLRHVKPHGALYNMAARDAALARAIAQAVRDFDPSLVLFGLSGSALLRAGRESGLAVASEVFADRTYQSDGSLTPRSHPDALIHDVRQSIDQVLRMVERGVVRSTDGHDVEVEAHTLCIHGDAPGARAFAQALRDALRDAGIEVAPPPAG
jgi:UPF0271 protein